MVGEGGKAVVGGCTGVVIKESHFVPPDWNSVLMMDEGDVRCCNDESDVRRWSVRPRSSELMM